MMLPRFSGASLRLCRSGRQRSGSQLYLPVEVQSRAGRSFVTTPCRRELLDVASLPNRILPQYKENPSGLLSLQWPNPPRNILILPKLLAPHVTESAVSFARHIQGEYPNLRLIFERSVAESIHEGLPFPIYTSDPANFPNKIDLVATLGGDGTILRAASLFSLHEFVPPILAFSMGSLGFLGEWKFEEYKRAWREVYMSGSRVAVSDLQGPHTQAAAAGRVDGGGEQINAAWGSVRGKSMGSNRSARVLLRNRLRVGIYDASGVNVNEHLIPTSTADLHQPLPPVPPEDAKSTKRRPSTNQGPAFHAINELVIHRGPSPHLAHIDVFVNGHHLTEAVADGLLVSTPTGSTAYSLSAGGSIMHPLVKALLITPICARSLSFRPLGLPLTSRVSLRLSDKNRGRDLEVSVDGKRRACIRPGMEIRVEGEVITPVGDGAWAGGVPCVIRSPGKGDGEKSGHGVTEDDDGWVGGLNGLLKFNYPFGEEH
ncbi:hypothetical protein DL770_000328 [Monosporascus sp. CRB-9-2]|nr:hypothetical protein DL770_000328 [Monosporascus sp. CRB-9-2]